MVPPKFVLILWPMIDKLLRATYHIRPSEVDGSGISCFHLHHYKGPTRVLSDGSEVKTGDTIIELHMNNDWFRRRRKPNIKASHSASEILGYFKQDLRLLAQQVDNGMFEGVKALHGSTLLYIGAKRLGFQVEGLPNTLWKKGASFYLAGLMQIYHLRTIEALKRRERSWELKEVWLSREALLTKYGPKHS
jgi:hypothetical protein